MSIKEQYWKYSLIVIILFMGIIIFRQITPFLGGLLGALTIYILVRTQMTHLTEKWKLKHCLHPTPHRTNHNGKHQQPCHQSVCHGIRTILYADRRKKDGSLCE